MAVNSGVGQGEVQSLFCASFSGAVRAAYVIPVRE